MYFPVSVITFSIDKSYIFACVPAFHVFFSCFLLLHVYICYISFPFYLEQLQFLSFFHVFSSTFCAHFLFFFLLFPFFVLFSFSFYFHFLPFISIWPFSSILRTPFISIFSCFPLTFLSSFSFYSPSSITFPLKLSLFL